MAATQQNEVLGTNFGTDAFPVGRLRFPAPLTLTTSAAGPVVPGPTSR